MKKEDEQIERILMEASAFNKRNEVIKVAESYLDDYPRLDKIEAYQQAYREECTDNRSDEELLAQKYLERHGGIMVGIDSSKLRARATMLGHTDAVISMNNEYIIRKI